jgi:spore maturation protein SpmA
MSTCRRLRIRRCVSLDSIALIRLAWIGLLALVTVLIPPTTIGVIAFRRGVVAPGNNLAVTFSETFQRAKALQMITVILIVIAAVFLALLRIIEPNGVVGILSGIAGYVLGGIQKEVPKSEETS